MLSITAVSVYGDLRSKRCCSSNQFIVHLVFEFMGRKLDQKGSPFSLLVVGNTGSDEVKEPPFWNQNQSNHQYNLMECSQMPTQKFVFAQISYFILMAEW